MALLASDCQKEPDYMLEHLNISEVRRISRENLQSQKISWEDSKENPQRPHVRLSTEEMKIRSALYRNVELTDRRRRVYGGGKWSCRSELQLGSLIQALLLSDGKMSIRLYAGRALNPEVRPMSRDNPLDVQIRRKVQKWNPQRPYAERLYPGDEDMICPSREREVASRNDWPNRRKSLSQNELESRGWDIRFSSVAMPFSSAMTRSRTWPYAGTVERSEVRATVRENLQGDRISREDSKEIPQRLDAKRPARDEDIVRTMLRNVVAGRDAMTQSNSSDGKSHAARVCSGSVGSLWQQCQRLDLAVCWNIRKLSWYDAGHRQDPRDWDDQQARLVNARSFRDWMPSIPRGMKIQSRLLRNGKD